MKINLKRFPKKKRSPIFAENEQADRLGRRFLDDVSFQEKNSTSFLSMAPIIRLMLLVALFHFSFGAAAQNITIKKNNATLISVLKNIEGQCKFVFFYKKADIQTVNNITVDFKDMPLNQVLNNILKQNGLEYQIFDKTIAIKKSANGKNNSADFGKAAVSSIKGKVVDENNLPIENILIKDPKSNTQTYTNQGGEFELPSAKEGTISLTGSGFAKKLFYYSDTAYVNIQMEKGDNQTNELASVGVSYNNQKENPTKFVDLENRSYMNLTQVLQGTIPGLSLQVVNSSSKTATSIDNLYRNPTTGITNWVRFSIEDFLAFYGTAKGQPIIDILLQGTNVPASISTYYRLNTTTTVTNTLVPQIRGSSNFSGSTSNMLVVIDGFPQDGFPANYPMTNVESIEVIKDPKELIKWGARAAGGAILVKTKLAKKGRIKVNYTTQLYYSPAPKFNRQKMQLASTPDYLDYLRSVDSVFSTASDTTTPAKLLLSQLRNKQITTTQFNAGWDSLSHLDNESQMALLSQNSFNQSHALTLSGGVKAYRFTLIGNYFGNKGNDLGGYDNTYNASLNNSFSLLKDRLHINWLVNYSNEKTKTGYSFSPTGVTLDPYQLLLDGQGNYVYDRTALSAANNQKIMALGYKDFGVNILEDAKLNSTISSIVQKKSNFNMNWDLLPGLKWVTSFLYTSRNTNNRILYNKQSSYVRQMVDLYGQYTPGGVNFYVPYGDILQATSTDYTDWNLRTSLAYSKRIGKHMISLSVGGGAASTTSTRPANTSVYGYNSATNTGGVIYLPAGSVTAPITNLYYPLFGTAASVSPYNLTIPTNGDTTKSRNLNGNVNFQYGYTDRLRFSGAYNSVLNPVYGQANAYSVLSSYKVSATGLVVKNWNRAIKDIALTTGADGMIMPNLLSQYTNLRYQQTYWGNYGIWVNGLTPTLQSGQKSTLVYEKMTIAMLDSVIAINGAYNVQKVNGGLTSLTSTSANVDSTTTTKYFSAGINMNLRKGLLYFRFDYSKSPEGTAQENGAFGYNVGREPYFRSKVISALDFSATLQMISPYQGLGLMLSTNVASNGSYSQATTSSFTTLPPQNTNFDAHGHISLLSNKYSLDLRYYNQVSNGLNNYVSTTTDPTTGLSSKVTYSSLTNRGLEFYLNTNLVKSKNFSYNVILNGAYNQNIAKSVPTTAFTANSAYTTALRTGYDASNIWTVKSAGLSATGDPQIYDKTGKIATTLDSATVSNSLVYAGVTKAPWTGGLIQEARLGQFFARTSITFSLGYVMRYYIPYPGTVGEKSILIKDRWRKAGDEKFTDIPAIAISGANTYRQFAAQYASNSILPADNIRLQEIMVGFNVPNKLIKKYGLESMVVTAQAQNVAVWSKNKLNIDPVTVSTDGRVGMPIPKIYSCNISLNF